MSGKAVSKKPVSGNKSMANSKAKSKAKIESAKDTARKSLRGTKKPLAETKKQSSSSAVNKSKLQNSNKALEKVAAEKKVRAAKKEPAVNYEKLILDHRENGRKLARSILRRWRVHMPGEDVDSIVDLALCEAAGRFSPKKGASFMTFFFYHLRGHLVRAVARATQASTILNGPKEGEEEEVSQDIISSYGSFIDNELSAQRDQENPEQIILRREKITVCRDALDQLDSLEKVVLEKSYGDDDTLVDIAKGLGYSRCHISRVKKSAMIRLKTLLQNSSLNRDGDESEQKQRVLSRLIRAEKIKIEKTARRKLVSKSKVDKSGQNKAAA